MRGFQTPKFEDGEMELRFADGEVCIYGTAEGLRRLAHLCSQLAVRPAPQHFHLEDYELLTSGSQRGTIAVFGHGSKRTAGSNLRTIASDWMGRRLTAVFATVRLHDGKLDSDDPDFIWFQFDDSALVRLRLASNGWNLLADFERPEPYDLDKYGEGVIIDFARHSAFGKYKGATIRRVTTLDSPETGNHIGIRLCFDEGDVAIFNWGDTLKCCEGAIADARGDPSPVIECPVTRTAGGAGGAGG